MTREETIARVLDPDAFTGSGYGPAAADSAREEARQMAAEIVAALDKPRDGFRSFSYERGTARVTIELPEETPQPYVSIQLSLREEPQSVEHAGEIGARFARLMEALTEGDYALLRIERTGFVHVGESHPFSRDGLDLYVVPPDEDVSKPVHTPQVQDLRDRGPRSA